MLCPQDLCPEPPQSLWLLPQALKKEEEEAGEKEEEEKEEEVQPDVDCLGPCSGGPRQWGRLLLSLEYDFGSQEPEQMGELCFSLRYVPSSGRLTVVVLEARGLNPGLVGLYVKVQLMLNQIKWKKRKTSCKKGTTSPYFNEAFTFLVPFSQLQKRNRAITARRQHLKSVMLQIAATELEKEESRRESEKENYLSEHCPPLHIPGSMSEVQELCKQLHAKIDVAEEEKYDMEVKVQKSSKELEDMNQKLFDLRGKFKRPPLRRVRMSADAMLKALLGSKHKVCMDLRANLKQVKKEDTEKERDLRDVGDWRKNIEEKSGMEGRKKMFESES
ncbi:hypothetical protein STEG23_014584 [Scotinomys teguina]